MNSENLYKLNKDLLIKIIEEVNDVKKWSVEQLVNNKREIEKVRKFHKYEKNINKINLVKRFFSQFMKIPQLKDIVEKNINEIENIYQIQKDGKIVKVGEFSDEFVEKILYKTDIWGYKIESYIIRYLLKNSVCLPSYIGYELIVTMLNSNFEDFCFNYDGVCSALKI